MLHKKEIPIKIPFAPWEDSAWFPERDMSKPTII